MEIRPIKALIEAISAACDAISKLADAVKHVVVIGVEGYDAARARMAYAELLDASVECNRLLDYQGVLTGRLRNYGDMAEELTAERRALAWSDTLDSIEETLNMVISLLYSVRKHRSDFVLEPACQAYVGA